jgi:hypothetical protein
MSENVYNTKEGFPVPEAHHPSDEQLLRLESGDATVINELVEGLTEYALNVVSHCIRVRPNYIPYREDLQSVALLATVESLNDRLGSRFRPLGLLSYLRKRIEWACLDYVVEMPACQVPARSARRLETLPKRQALREFHIIDEDPFAEIDFDDFVDIKLNCLQKEILHLRRAGHQFREIADILELTVGDVENELVVIRKMFETEYLD